MVRMRWVDTAECGASSNMLVSRGRNIEIE